MMKRPLFAALLVCCLTSSAMAMDKSTYYVHDGVGDAAKNILLALKIITHLVVRSILLKVKVKRRNPAPYFYKEPFAPSTMAVSSICFRKADTALSLSPVKIASKIC